MAALLVEKDIVTKGVLWTRKSVPIRLLWRRKNVIWNGGALRTRMTLFTPRTPLIGINTITRGSLSTVKASPSKLVARKGMMDTLINDISPIDMKSMQVVVVGILNT